MLSRSKTLGEDIELEEEKSKQNTMKRYCSVVLLGLAIYTVLQVADSHVKLDVECNDTSDCSAEECCVLVTLTKLFLNMIPGMHPNSIPSCVALGDLGHPCLPNNEAVNTSVTYPNGETIHLTNVYRMYCNCVEGLSCEQTSATCVENHVFVFITTLACLSLFANISNCTGLDVKKQKITNHSSRCTAVSNMTQEQELIKITGHSNASFLKPYLQINKEHHSEILNKLRNTPCTSTRSTSFYAIYAHIQYNIN
ncbi:hypothetical protein ANN_02861 [Periplaneta americana]|uniref:Uncharacterized protein n=1 Tax=Periplaneta americana TaxID=6978 RepID=A0ABQ8U138_PERAM|nr:hypothetical protein ANN_02861 [Periplaneta americana]